MIYYVIYYVSPNSGELKEEKCFTSMDDAMQYFERLESDDYELQTLSKQELLERRWLIYEQKAEEEDKYWKKKHNLFPAMLDLVDSMFYALLRNEDNLHHGRKKQKSIVCYEEDYCHGSPPSFMNMRGTRKFFVRLRAEISDGGTSHLFIERRDTTDTKWFATVTVRIFENLATLMEWLSHFRMAAERCVEAFLLSAKRDSLEEIMSLPTDTPGKYLSQKGNAKLATQHI